MAPWRVRSCEAIWEMIENLAAVCSVWKPRSTCQRRLVGVLTVIAMRRLSFPTGFHYISLSSHGIPRSKPRFTDQITSIRTIKHWPNLHSLIRKVPYEPLRVHLSKLLETIPNPIIRSGRCEVIPFLSSFLFLFNDLGECCFGPIYHIVVRRWD
jgi:hypothetical protein